jgi:hypothetical protein
MLQRCYFCGSNDSMTPFKKEARVLLLSWLIPRLRWSYCRSCTRHFLMLVKRTPNRTD